MQDNIFTCAHTYRGLSSLVGMPIVGFLFIQVCVGLFSSMNVYLSHLGGLCFVHFYFAAISSQEQKKQERRKEKRERKTGECVCV